MKRLATFKKIILMVVSIGFFSGCVSVSKKDFAEGRGRFCAGECPKTVTIFLDDFAKQDLEEHNVKPKDFLHAIFEIYWTENGLDFSYDEEDSRIVDWHHSEKYNVFKSTSVRMLANNKGYKILTNEMIWKHVGECYTDVCFFLSGDLILGEGLSIHNLFFHKGSGPILMGTGEYDNFLNSISQDNWKNFSHVLGDANEKKAKIGFIRRFPEYSKLSYLAKLARVGAHEQAHLFGVGHSNDLNSIMYPIGTGSKRFDIKSMERLGKYLRYFPIKRE